MKTTVYKLGTKSTFTYSLPPKNAVIAAYAQDHDKNFNTWTYHEYNNQVLEGKHGWHLGDYSAPYNITPQTC